MPQTNSGSFVVRTSGKNSPLMLPQVIGMPLTTDAFAMDTPVRGHQTWNPTTMTLHTIGQSAIDPPVMGPQIMGTPMIGTISSVTSGGCIPVPNTPIVRPPVIGSPAWGAPALGTSISPTHPRNARQKPHTRRRRAQQQGLWLPTHTLPSSDSGSDLAESSDEDELQTLG